MLRKTLNKVRLKTVLWRNCAKIEQFANILAKTIIVNCNICKKDVPLLRIYIAAAAPRQLCPIVGRVSMDQITVRLPKVYPLGTPVTLMGENGGASITATEVAEKRGTINYEVLCLLSDRVPRSYD